MKLRKLGLTVSGVGAVVMAVTSLAWACSGSTVFGFPTADMTLENATNETWAGGEKGQNFGTCPPSRYAAQNTGGTPNCQRPVDITGTNFINATPAPASSVGSVKLYWLDEPYFAAGLGGPFGQGERLDAMICQTKGVLLNPSSPNVSVDSAGKFTATVTLPPTEATSFDGTKRATTYGANAVCAVWFHNPDNIVGNADDHFAAVGNQYTLYPA